jgi:hypothetical protein
MTLIPIEKRVAKLEREMKTVGDLAREALTVSKSNREALIEVKGTTDTILEVVSYAQSGGRFLAKHGPRMVAAVSGAAVSAGLLNPKVGAFFVALFN